MNDSAYYWLKTDMKFNIDSGIEMQGNLPFIKNRNLFVIIAKKFSENNDDSYVPAPRDGDWTNCVLDNISWVEKEKAPPKVKPKKEVTPNLSTYGGMPRFSAGRGTSIIFASKVEAAAVADLMRREGLV